MTQAEPRGGLACGTGLARRVERAAGVVSYEAKLYARTAAWTALALAALLPLAFWLPAAPEARAKTAMAVVETFGVVASPLLAGALFSREAEEGTAEILYAKPVRRGALLAVRLVLAVATLAASLIVTVGVYRMRGVDLPLGGALLTAGPGGLVLAAFGLAVGTATRVSAAGYLVPVAYWAFDWGTRGAHTGMLTLFARSLAEPWWPSSKVLLAGAALGLVALAYRSLVRRA